MKYALSGTPHIIRWTYDEHLPLEGSIRAAVYGNTGESLYQESLADNTKSLVIPVEHQTISVGRDFDTRRVVIEYDTYGGPERLTFLYRVVDIPLITVGEKDVRAYIGIQTEELPDEDIDLVAAYFKVADLVQGPRLRDFLTSGTNLELKANELIMLQTVLDVGPSLLQRIAHTMQDANLRVARNSVKNFEDLLGMAAGRFAELLAEMQPPAAGTATLPLFTLVPETPDAITGA